MRSQRVVESSVGIFMLLALFGFCVLAFKVSGLTNLFPSNTYTVIANFDDIGGLKVRAPVKIGGVQIGQVAHIDLDPLTFKAVVRMHIDGKFNKIPNDSTAGILTAGLLGDNYISITPMYSPSFFTNNAKIEITHSAMVLEKLIGQFIYKLGNGDNNKDANAGQSSQTGGEVHAP
jgi:phospholipid/cholesterol/gamma-HCH transport system substrate-binding protein